MMHDNVGDLEMGNGGRRKAALILAGAAARGPFAAGALKIIAAQDIFDVRVVVGTSSGALNAAVYAAGLRAGKAESAARRLVELWTNDATWWRILPRGSRRTLVHRPLEEFSREKATRDVTLRMVVSSLEGQERVTAGHRYTTFEKTYSYSAAQLGDHSRLDEIASVAAASSAIPFVFPPVSIGNGVYADGGLVEDAPIAWALHEHGEIDNLLVVTPDPPLAPPAGLKDPVSFARRLLEIIVQERLSRDLHVARSFNEELARLGRLGVDLTAVRKALGWRHLQLIEIRPEHEPAEGGFVSGFFSTRQRKAAIRAGEACAERALATWRDAAAHAELVRPDAQRRHADRVATNGASGTPPMGTSKHLRGRSEILLVAPIKPGLVPGEHAMTYATRLKLLLQGLFALRQAGAERLALDVAGPLDKIRSLHFVQWGILDGSRLVLAVTFDGPWESYIRNIVDDGGAFLDVIFCHCLGYDKHATEDGFEPFAHWVREHQVECDYFHAAAPDLSADDIRFLKQLERLRSSSRPDDFPPKAAALSVLDTPATARGVPPADPTIVGDVINAFFALSVLFTQEQELQYFKGATRLELRLLNFDPSLSKPPQVSDVAWRWALSIGDKKSPSREPQTIEAIETVQGNILSGYPNMTRGCLVFLQFDDAAAGRRFLQSVRVTTHSDGIDGQPTCNVGLTFDGLQTLRLNHHVLADFPEEFREGMQERAPMLGDIGRNHPQNWVLPEANWPDRRGDRIELSTIDAVVILQAGDSEQDGEGLEAWIRTQIQTRIGERGARVLGFQSLERHGLAANGTFVEHFGFRDGFSQPVPNASNFAPDPSVPDRDRVAVGEILLGYKNERGELNVETFGAGSRRVVKNGAFLAIRKLRQDVAAFDAFVRQQVGAYSHSSAAGRSVEDVLKAKLMGRFPDGEPVFGWPSPKPNDFDYSPDPNGKECPLFAHVRRANPRIDRKTPRIVRRGFSYGRRYEQDRENRDRGLVFMAYAASLGQQFEVIQGWVNGGNSTGTLSSHADPLTRDATSEPLDLLHPPGSTDRLLRLDPPGAPITSVEWGLYLFVPSTRGLAEIADLAGKASAEADDESTTLIRQGEAMCKRLDSLNSAEAWQAALEDVASVKSATAAAVWAAIRHNGGRKLTPYGLLVGSADQVANVLSNDSVYSVCEYGKRMSDSLGRLYLGLDGGPSYKEASSAPNDFIRKITCKEAYRLALRVADDFLRAPIPQPPHGQAPARRQVDLQAFSDRVIGTLAEAWFGAPERAPGATEDTGACVDIGSVPEGNSLVVPADFRLASEYIFQPRPSDWLRKELSRRKEIVQENALHFARTRREAIKHGPATHTLMDHLLRNNYGLRNNDGSDEEVSRAWLGAINGFVAPTGGSFLSVMGQWIDGKALWRLQQQFWRQSRHGGEAPTDDPPAWLQTPLLAAMSRIPIPDLLYRESTQPFVIRKSDGSEERHDIPDQRVVVSLASAAAEQAGRTKEPWILFGGDDARPPAETGIDTLGRPRHPCPGRDMAIGVLLGMVVAIFRQRDLRKESFLRLSCASS